MLPPELFDFLFDLDVHNERPWFEANRERYESEVREPVRQFIREVADPLHDRVSRFLVADDRKQGGSMFRIHRDVRFSKDKTPYKIHVGVQLRHERGRDVHAPGVYLHLEPGHCFVGSGMWRPGNEALNALRDDIEARPAVFKRMRTQLDVGAWEFGGDSLKRAPRGRDPDHPLIDELRRTSWILIHPIDESDTTATDFVDTFIELVRQTRPLLRWQGRILDLKI